MATHAVKTYRLFFMTYISIKEPNKNVLSPTKFQKRFPQNLTLSKSSGFKIIVIIRIRYFQLHYATKLSPQYFSLNLTIFRMHTSSSIFIISRRFFFILFVIICSLRKKSTQNKGDQRRISIS